MEQSQNTTLVRVLASSAFEGTDVATIEWRGKPTWSARSVSTALGYTNDDQISKKIPTDWSSDLVDGTDYVVVRGEDLAAVKAAGLCAPQAPSLMLLTESGVHLVCLLSRQPKARALRRWLADEVLPSLRRSGTYSMPGATKPAGSLGELKERGSLMLRASKALHKAGALSNAEFVDVQREVLALARAGVMPQEAPVRLPTSKSAPALPGFDTREVAEIEAAVRQLGEPFTLPELHRLLHQKGHHNHVAAVLRSLGYARSLRRPKHSNGLRTPLWGRVGGDL